MRLTVKVFSATDAPEDCRRNAVACLQVLRRYGIANITSAYDERARGNWEATAG